MSLDEFEARSAARRRARASRARRRRLAICALAAVLVVIVAAVAIAGGGGGRGKPGAPHGSARSAATPAGRSSRASAGAARSGTTAATAATGKPGTGKPGTATVPILMYHVISPAPTGAPFPGLYVNQTEFAAQMAALHAAGWHAVTMNQLEAYWTRGVPLPAGKPIVVSFDNGYTSQYTHALPVLRRLGWVGDENIQLTGLTPSQGGLTDAQVRGLLAAGWELDTQGISHADLIRLDASQLRQQVAGARATLRHRYGVPVNWFCYPSGHYDATVIAEVKAAGYVGSTTVVPGWAGPGQDRFALPRLRVLGGTSPGALLSQIAAAQGAAAPPGSYGSPGSA